MWSPLITARPERGAVGGPRPKVGPTGERALLLQRSQGNRRTCELISLQRALTVQRAAVEPTPLVGPRLVNGISAESVYQGSMALLAQKRYTEAIALIMNSYSMEGRDHSWDVTTYQRGPVEGWAALVFQGRQRHAVFRQVGDSCRVDGPDDEHQDGVEAATFPIHPVVVLCPTTVPAPGDRAAYARFVSLIWHEATHAARRHDRLPRAVQEFTAYWAQILNAADLPPLTTAHEDGYIEHAFWFFDRIAPEELTDTIRGQAAQLRFYQQTLLLRRFGFDGYPREDMPLRDPRGEAAVWVAGAKHAYSEIPEEFRIPRLRWLHDKLDPFLRGLPGAPQG